MAAKAGGVLSELEEATALSLSWDFTRHVATSSQRAWTVRVVNRIGQFDKRKLDGKCGEFMNIPEYFTTARTLDFNHRSCFVQVNGHDIYVL